jgi:DMSO/TMAO reductase YedYZ molybdopterin-dependent catalytic subunit
MPGIGVWRGAVAGAVGGLVSVAAMEGLSRLAGLETLPAMLQSPILSVMPGAVFGFLIDNLQHWGKVLEEGSLLLAMVVALAVLGAAAATLTRWRPDLRAGILAGAVAWLLVMVAVLPVAQKGIFGLREGVQPLVFWALVFAVYAFVWEWLAQPRATQEVADPTRRRLLAVLPAGVAAASVGAIGLLRVPEWLSTAATPPESMVQGPVPALTPANEFYVVSKNFQDPVVSASGWALEVGGMAASPLRLGLSELAAIPGVTQTITLECVSNTVGGPLMSTGRFTGVPLRDLLVMASPRAGAHAVTFTSHDGYTESLPLDLVMQTPEILVAYRLNGGRLPDQHGFPARIVVPGRYGMKSAKWLDSIALVAGVEDGYWEQQGWDREAVVRTTARFDVPADGSLFHVNVPAKLAGVAFAGLRGVRAVEWTNDDGRTWTEAELEPPLSPLTWVRWRSSWTPGRQGSRQLRVRARDGSGAWQTVTDQPSFPSGATGHHRVDVWVGSP